MQNPYSNLIVRVLVVVSVMLLCVIPVDAATNLITNASFEESDANGIPVGWEGYSQSKFGDGISVVLGNAHVGERSLSFDPKKGTTLGMRSMPIPVVAGATYVASGYAMTEAANKKASFLH